MNERSFFGFCRQSRYAKPLPRIMRMTILIVATMAVWALTTIIAFTRNDK